MAPANHPNKRDHRSPLLRRAAMVSANSGLTIVHTLAGYNGPARWISESLFLCFGGYFATFAASLLGPKV
jgi:hypothetical protein